MKRLLLLIGGMLLMIFALGGWTAVKIVAWVRDIPNRIVIEGDAMASAFGAAVTESYHHALRKGDSTMQLQVMNEQFTPLIKERPDAAIWVRNEFRIDILNLVDSNDPAVSIAASQLLDLLDANSETVKQIGNK